MTTPKPIPNTIEELLHEIDNRYHNDALVVDENFKTDKERHEYIGKLKLIREIKVLLGVHKK